MPDSIELARGTDYYVNFNPMMPDGIHQYKGTKPLEIPVSFKLHSFDQHYCKQGALTLLQLAARLHSFVLPISTFSNNVQVVPLAAPSRSNEGQPNQGKMEADAATTQGFEVVHAGKGGNLYSPVTCWLHLMWTSNSEPGISAVGYVREVKVQFNGPWLRGPNNSFNLPTSADFSFVFIHRPGHGNSGAIVNSQFPPTVANSGHAYAGDVKDVLYNTRHLVWAANYQGFGPESSREYEKTVEVTVDEP